MALKIRLKQYKNASKSSFGKYYAETVLLGEVHTADIARQVSENTTFRPGEVKGIIDEVVAVMTREMQDGNAVVIDVLGRFRLMVESEGVEKAKDFNIGQHIRRIVCKFLPAAHRIGDDREVKSTGRREQLFSEGADVEWYKG
jgi:predicted histone-like DNA-binding protein